MMSDLAVVNIFRFDPSVDEAPRFETYNDIPYKGRNVLETLQHIYEERDPTLAFRGPCEANSCKGCAVIVNGRAELACEKKAEAEMTIEPLPKFEIIRDLVVDFSKTKNS